MSRTCAPVGESTTSIPPTPTENRPSAPPRTDTARGSIPPDSSHPRTPGPTDRLGELSNPVIPDPVDACSTTCPGGAYEPVALAAPPAADVDSAAAPTDPDGSTGVVAG